MPNTKSAIRRVRRIKKQTLVNRVRKSKYKSAIKRHIETNWVIPQSSRWEGSCTAFVIQNPALEVTSVNIESCNSDFAYKKSLENAIWKSSPFPLAPNEELFEREVKISFKSLSFENW